MKHSDKFARYFCFLIEQLLIARESYLIVCFTRFQFQLENLDCEIYPFRGGGGGGGL